MVNTSNEKREKLLFVIRDIICNKFSWCSPLVTTAWSLKVAYDIADVLIAQGIDVDN